ncbi:MAG: c-type cytochrome [Acidobacteria bacterium]|nr:c-type cytochrome [Acidobacteriota bacterium]
MSNLPPVSATLSDRPARSPWNPSRWLGRILPIAACVALGGTCSAQAPMEFKNLQLFPKGIAQEELIANMKNFAVSLGVRCNFCHVGEEGAPLDTFDFASDEKEPKRVARIMIRMRDAINADHLTKAAHHHEGAARVDCVTCHRGQNHPPKPEEILAGIMSGQSGH